MREKFKVSPTEEAQFNRMMDRSLHKFSKRSSSRSKVLSKKIERPTEIGKGRSRYSNKTYRHE